MPGLGVTRGLTMMNQLSTILMRARETLATTLATLDLGSILIFQILFLMSQSQTLEAWEPQASIQALTRMHLSSQATVPTATLEDQDSILAGLGTLDSTLEAIRTMGSILAVLALVLLDLEALKHLSS